jgi:hypothetical protein
MGSSEPPAIPGIRGADHRGAGDGDAAEEDGASLTDYEDG